ncbi:uncharacterized protein DUF3987 [Buttiauxella sp. JUb87]|uniref:YfjI family protein n=1 Tax=Buttiauxella sp. JUb87 TaxID=2485129 RepID=UPI00105C5ED6|nr:YfjI family protein [Buttiauxella sp. JUb87]TDN50234.1 uncharacterized protein DUF3987 [Buttiauxella sp. JUb87]
MNNQSNYSRVKNQPGTQGNHATKEHEGSFPVHCLPELLKNTAERVNLFTGMPIELIVSVLMTTLSIISQYLVRIISPYTGASGPCSLYLLTLAESGEGKTFLSRLFMKPVHQQLEKMKHEYNRQLARYKNEHLIWKTGLQGLNANLRQAIKKGYGVEDVQIQLEKHYKSEPERPVEPKFIYQDVTFKALIQGLSQHAEAGIIMDEAIPFFRSGLKNHLGLLNTGWDGGTYSFNRADGESYELPLSLMFSLLIQNDVFMAYLEKHGEVAKGSGFLPRFLVTRVKSSIGQRSHRIDEEGLNAILTPFYDRLWELLELLESRFYDNTIPKDQLKLSDSAKKLLQERQCEIERAIAPGGRYAHIRDFASKATEQAIRLAAIMEVVSVKPAKNDLTTDLVYTNIIHASRIRNSLLIVEWHLQQTSSLFYPMSEESRFKSDVRALWCFINKKLIQGNGVPFPKHELLQFGPGRLRYIDKLTPVLNQLINQGLCCIININHSSAQYIAGMLRNGFVCLGGYTCPYSIVQTRDYSCDNVRWVDLSDLPGGA